jgi:hypothetical protein
VLAVAGLAPWLPPGEPVEQLAGRRILLAHGNADRVTRPADTWAFAERAGPVTDVTAIEIRTGEHAMLRRALVARPRRRVHPAGPSSTRQHERAGRRPQPNDRGLPPHAPVIAPLSPISALKLAYRGN